MYNNYSLEVKRIFKDAEKIAIDLNHPYIGTEHLLLSLINNDDKIKKILLKYDLTYDEFLDELLLVVGTSENKKCTCIYTPLLKRVIKTADEISKNKMMEPMHLLEAILEEGEGIAIRIMISMGIDIDKLYDEIKKFKYELEIREKNIYANIEEFEKKYEKDIFDSEEIKY